jgi:hypothetical protein
MVSKQGGTVWTMIEGKFTVVCDGDKRETTALLLEERNRR